MRAAPPAQLIINKARGKSGPLFHFDVHDDIRIGAHDHREHKSQRQQGLPPARHGLPRHLVQSEFAGLTLDGTWTRP